MALKINNTIFLTGVLFFFATGAQAQSTELSNSMAGLAKTAEDYYNEGRNLADKGEYRKADEAFKKAELLLNNSSSNPYSQESGGDNLDNAVNPAKVGAVPEKKLSDKNNAANNQKDAAAKKKKDASKQEDVLERAAKAYKDKDYNEAISLYQKALKKYPKNRDIKYNIATVYLAKGDYAIAAEEFKKVIALNVRDADAYYNLAVIYENLLKDYAQAIIYYGRFLQYSDNAEDKEKIKQWLEYIKNRDIR